MDQIDNLIATGQVVLYLARELDAAGRTEEALKMYRRALLQGLMIQRLKHQSDTDGMAFPSLFQAVTYAD